MTRSEIKARARAQLGGNIFGANWLKAMLVCLIVGAIVGAASSIIPGVGSLVLTGPLSFGAAYLFLKQARDRQEMDLGKLFIGFSEHFAQSFLLGLMTYLFVFLWSLLFIIPGIVKSYAYSMAFYIKTDHQEYDWRQCIDESRAMMNGHKAELFVLDLSFIGWMIVGSLCFGVGSLWVLAYMEAAHAQFYESLCSQSAGGSYGGGSYDAPQSDAWTAPAYDDYAAPAAPVLEMPEAPDERPEPLYDPEDIPRPEDPELPDYDGERN